MLHCLPVPLYVIITITNNHFTVPYIDAVNAFGKIERDCTRVALLANPSLYMLIPLF